MKKTSLFVIVTLIVAVGFYFIVYVLPFLFVSSEDLTNDIRCKSEKRALEENISGLLINKFRDKDNHLWETITYSNSTGSHQSVIFMNEESGDFDSLLPGDSVFKISNSLELDVKRESVIIKNLLIYGCRMKSE